MKEIERWKPPPQDWLKCNSDAAWDESKENCRLGWVLRDHMGCVLWMGARSLSRLRSPIEAEAEALRWALLNMVRFNYRRVIFESDCKELIQAIQEESYRPSIRTYTADILHKLDKIGDHRVVFKSRQGNEVADRVAKEASNFESNSSVLFSTMPSWIQTYVEADKPMV
ncbi:PREDICTED: uncharacterized protein LOC106331101 [Brassica oleracea var. oleracea]|uniref:uncharacterized protein LOC106331101 n=1 Tax=Brassica oleracea var. oleracea TaxID=109376 RepID=UPI0006A72161|nr:PREDICTED: uncharacterized protein LOC106331101 [Brassica oleracea var. oleracea]